MPNRPVVTLDISVLLRLAGLDVLDRYTLLLSPYSELLADVFGAMTTCPLRERRSAEVWALASTMIATAVRAKSEEDLIGVRDFLDSRSGRHFADDVMGALQSGTADSASAIKATIAKWQGWRISA